VCWSVERITVKFLKRIIFTNRKKLSIYSSVADPGCFITDPDPNSLPSQIRIQTFFIPEPGSYIKRGMKNKNWQNTTQKSFPFMVPLNKFRLRQILSLLSVVRVYIIGTGM
jgi:hypothetical protein